jgi:hypothetical protein
MEEPHVAASVDPLIPTSSIDKPAAVRFRFSSAIKSLTPAFMRTPFKTTDTLTLLRRGTGLTPIIEELEDLHLLSSTKKSKDDSDAKVRRKSLLEETKQESTSN